MDLRKDLLEREKKWRREKVKSLQSNGMKLKAPLLYVLIGDQTEKALENLRENMKQNLLNAEGVVFLIIENSNMASEEQAYRVSESDNVVRLQLKTVFTDMERGKLTQLLEKEDFLEALNEAMLKTKQLILKQGKCFSYWEQVYVSFITLAREPLNILIPDFTLLIKSKLEQDFKQVSLELFTLIEEGKEDSRPMNKALCYSFFKELEVCQSPLFHYEEAIETVDEGIKLKVRADTPLFDLVYILSDKNEKGQLILEAEKKHYETIVAVNLLKNREQKQIDLETAREQYNQNVFLSNIQEQGENRFCTAQLAKVRKPDTGIYYSALYHLFRFYTRNINEQEAVDSTSSFMEAAGLTRRQREEIVKSCMPEAEGLENILSLLVSPVTFNEMKSLNFEEAEKLLYGKSAEDFFRINFKESAEKKLNKRLSDEAIKESLITGGINNPSFGPVAVKRLFNSEVFKGLEVEEEAYRVKIKQYKDELSSGRAEIVGEKIGNAFRLFDKKCIRAIKNQLIHEIYGINYFLLEEELKLEALIKVRAEAKLFLEKLDKRLQKLEAIDQFLLQRLEDINKYEEEYLVQNVKEYYEEVVREKIKQLQSKWGKDCLYDPKYMGPIEGFLEADEETSIIKLCEISEKEILSDEKVFGTAFEEELLSRANMHIDYEDKEVVAKGTLYDFLQNSLEENSIPCVYLDTTLCTHSYKEKYFLGNGKSEFIRYAYEKDQSSHSCKVGTVYEARNNVIEKLQLMGGFRLSDLVFTKSAERYYEGYLEKGYCFQRKE